MNFEKRIAGSQSPPIRHLQVGRCFEAPRLASAAVHNSHRNHQMRSGELWLSSRREKQIVVAIIESSDVERCALIDFSAIANFVAQQVLGIEVAVAVKRGEYGKPAENGRLTKKLR